jgi:hypothetical protein
MENPINLGAMKIRYEASQTPLSSVLPHRILIVNTAGGVGKSIVASSLLYRKLCGVILSMHGVGGGTSDYMVAATHIPLDDPWELPMEMLRHPFDNLIIDVGASAWMTLERLFMAADSGWIKEEITLAVVPAVPGSYGERAAIETIIWLRRRGIRPEQIRIVFNKAEPEKAISKQFPLVSAFLASHPELVEVSEQCRVPQAWVLEQSFQRYALASLVEVGLERKLQVAVAEHHDENSLQDLRFLVDAQCQARMLIPQLDRAFTSLNFPSQ